MRGVRAAPRRRHLAGPLTPAPLLLLWDIDGTLVQRASREHAQALHEAIEEVHGVDATVRRVAFEAAGRTDREIARALLRGHDVSDERIDERFDALLGASVRRYRELVPSSLRDHVVEGIPALLEELAARDDVRLSLVTGNVEGIARLKLAAAGLGGFFLEGQGGFGSDAEQRAELPPVALRRAGDHPPARALVIGDTPRDIACARAADVGVLAVTSGPHPATDLTEADAVCESTAALRAAILART